PPPRLDGPADDQELYEALGEQCGDLRPICQGDVFSGVTLPGFDEDHELVMLVGHPCTLREGPALRPRLQAAPVRSYQRVPARKWPTRDKKVFPLPGPDDAGHLAASLAETGMARREQLTYANRVVTLAPRAILLLQQRIVWNSAHTVVRLDTFEEHNAPMLTELGLLEDWNIRLC